MTAGDAANQMVDRSCVQGSGPSHPGARAAAAAARRTQTSSFGQLFNAVCFRPKLAPAHADLSWPSARLAGHSSLHRTSSPHGPFTLHRKRIPETYVWCLGVKGIL